MFYNTYTYLYENHTFVPFFLSGISVYQFLHIREANSIGQQLVTSTKAFSHHPPNPTLDILVLGDSLAVGVGASDTSNSIAGRIAKDYPTADMTNAAKSGARLNDVIDQLQPFMNDRFDILLIQIGGNDETHVTSIKQVHRDMNTIITQAKKYRLATDDQTI